MIFFVARCLLFVVSFALFSVFFVFDFCCCLMVFDHFVARCLFFVVPSATFAVFVVFDIFVVV